MLHAGARFGGPSKSIGMPNRHQKELRELWIISQWLDTGNILSRFV